MTIYTKTNIYHTETTGKIVQKLKELDNEESSQEEENAETIKDAHETDDEGQDAQKDERVLDAL